MTNPATFSWQAVAGADTYTFQLIERGVSGNVVWATGLTGTSYVTSLLITPEIRFNGDLERYAREVVWYGRKGGKFRHSDVADATAAR